MPAEESLRSAERRGLHGGRLVTAAVWGLVLSPFLFYAAMLPRFGELQRNDYWANWRRVVSGDQLRTEPERWLLARSNEHRIALPLLLWTANARLTHGDNRGLSAISLVLLISTFAMLRRRLPSGLTGIEHATHGLLISGWIATLAAAHCWVLGFSGNQWFLANASVVGAVLLFTRAPDESADERFDGAAELRQLGWAMLAAIPGMFAHATHLALWPTLFLGAIWLRMRRRTVWAVFACGLLVVAFFALDFRPPAREAPPGHEATSLWSFVLTYFGMPFTRDPATSRIWGLLAVAGLVGAIVLVVRSSLARRRTLVPWLLIALYGAGNALGTSVSRAHWGDEMALSSRYASLPALLWLGTSMTWLLWLRGRARTETSPLRRWAPGLVSVAILGATLPAGWVRLEKLLGEIPRQPLTALAMRWNVEDRPVLAEITPKTEQLRIGRAWFERIGHKPFDRNREWPLGSVVPARPIQAAATSAMPESQGEASLDEVRPVDRRFLSVGGRTGTKPSDPPGRVLILDRDGVLRGGGEVVPRGRGRRVSILASPDPGRRWSGYLERVCGGGLVAYFESGPEEETTWTPLAISPDIASRVEASCSS